MFFTIFLRRIQRFALPVKIISLIILTASLIFLIVNVPPGVGSITLAALLLFPLLVIILSFFRTTRFSLLAALTVSFFLFLRAVDLLSPVNIILFVIFLLLLGLYMRKK